ncbi:hypothetical protein GGX14DRAFT_483628 [Mycena pura]|uniref:Uncharacterized protein n=1 Tax=Mycena pura TaxID=153505 RepID=A0AAD6UTS7_9AGAR|nr:hypothetical protein GGX14DRAFT_483628 [Mycena pura]
MSIASDLAQELVDAIVDFLHNDRATLLSSSLVARKWVPATRHHLFERIAIHQFRHRGPRRFRDTASSFIALCSSPFCGIVPSIQDVVLNVDSDFHPAPGIQALVAVLARAPVRKIVFIDHTSAPAQPSSLSWLSLHFPGLREFAYSALGRFIPDVFTLVASLPELRSLALYSGSKESAKRAISQAMPYPALFHTVFAHLRTLRLRLYAPQADEFLGWLLTLGDHLRVETLDLTVFHCYHNGWGPVAALNSFFCAQGRHLRHLRIQIRYEDSDGDLDEDARLSEDSAGDLDFSPLTNLQSLLLNSHNVDAVCTALASLPSRMPSLTSLEVDFKEWIYWDDFPCDCNPSIMVYDFAGVMSEDQFAQLTEFVIRVPEFFGDRGREALKDYFPRWDNTDVVSVLFVEQDTFQVDSAESVWDSMFGSMDE